MIESKVFFENINLKSPLVHHITNYVTVNDCANITLAIGASPIMTAQILELEDIIKISSSLVINIGTMDKLDAFLQAPKYANKYDKKIVLDPVGAGATGKRNEIIEEMLQNSRFSVIKGNLSEILSIAKVSSNTKGVDVSDKDKEIKTDAIIDTAISLAKEHNCIIAITGKEDIVANSKYAYILKNGVPLMSKVSGTGCMSASIIASFIGANDDDFISTIIALSSMGIAGELAYEKTKNLGNGSFRVSLIDEINNMDYKIFEKFAKIEKYK